tara:strand:- start:173 stop:337 length:165 start_codon:yes stop_codon:yes gene_type:complete
MVIIIIVVIPINGKLLEKTILFDIDFPYLLKISDKVFVKKRVKNKFNKKVDILT